MSGTRNVVKREKKSSGGHRERAPMSPRELAHLVLLWMGRALLLGMIAVVPWYYGSANWSPQFFMVQASWGLLVITILSIAVEPSKAKSICGPAIGLLAFMILGLFQVTPLPFGLAGSLSGNAAFEERVQQFARGWVPEPDQVTATSLDPSEGVQAISIDRTQSAATIAALVTAVACLICSTQLFTSRFSIMLLASVMVTIACSHCFLGLMQTVSWNKWTWLEMPHGTHFSTFVSRNSAPQYYATGIGAALVLLVISMRDQRKKKAASYQITYPSADILSRLRRRLEEMLVDLSPMSILAIVALLILSIGVLAASSRGGIIAHVSAAVVVLAMVLSKKVFGFAHMLFVVTLLGLGTLLFSLCFGLDDSIANRFEGFEDEVVFGRNGRLLLWQMVMQALPTYWLFGSGLGTFHFGILPFHTVEPDMWFYHAESIPVEILFETGVLGLAIFSFVCASIFKSTRRELERKKHKNVLVLAVIYCLIAIGIQSLVDFSLILPAVFVPALALLGAFYAEGQRLTSERRRSRDSHSISLPRQEKSIRTLLASYGVASFVLALAYWIGFDALAGYAASEQLAYRVQFARAHSASTDTESGQRAKPPTASELGDEAAALLDRYPTHPEALVQSSRGLQYVCQQRAIEAWDWQELPLEKRRELTNPRFLASSIRNPAQVPIDFRKLVDSDPVNAKFTRKVHESYVRAAQLSPQDWRAAAGVFHSDFAWLDHLAQIRAAARVFLLAGGRREIAVDVAHLLIIERKKQPGLEIFQRISNSAPHRLLKVLSSLAYHLSPEEVLRILPADLAVQARACRTLASHPRWPEYRESMLQGLVEQIEKVTHPKQEDCLEFAWVARESRNFRLETNLLRTAVARNATRHDIRFLFAKSLLDSGSGKQALAEVGSCLNQSPKNEEYLAFQKKLIAQLDSGGS